MNFSVLDYLNDGEAAYYLANAKPWGQQRTDEERKKQHFISTGGLAQKRKKMRRNNENPCDK